MRYLISFIFLYLSLYASTEHWQTVLMPNICTFKIPPTMEVQAGTYKKLSDKLQKEILEIPVDSTRVLAQQKDLNKYKKKAFKTYARIMVETEYGRKGDYEKITTQLTATKFELRELGGIFRQNMEKELRKISAKGKMTMKLISWFPVQIVEINGVSMIHLKYTRSVNNGPEALVNMYIVQNDDRMHRITISYRISNADLYKDDLSKVINTFKFNQGNDR